MRLPGATAGAQITAEEVVPGVSNYFVGSDPTRWHSRIPHYAKVRYHEIYAGVDLVYYGNQKRLEYDFAVAPGADPQKISIAVEDLGTSRVPPTARVTKDGVLFVKARAGEIH